MKTSLTVLSLPSLLRNLDWSNPYVENILLTEPDDALAVNN